MHVALYVRASTDLQQYSIANQRAVLTAYAIARGYEVARVFEDDGKSGLNLGGRPGLKTLLAEALGPYPAFKAVLVYDVTRWGRFQDADESAHYEFLCRNAGIKIVYCAEPFENDGSPMSHVLKAIKRTMAAEYSRELSEKVARGKRRLAEMGYAQAKPVYGLRRMLVDENDEPLGILEAGQRKAIQTHRVVMVPGPTREVKVVQRIFRLFAYMGLGYTDIARFLDRAGVPSVSGGNWNPDTIRLMLRNEAYVGVMIYGRRRCRLKSVTSAPEEEWVRKPNALPPIISMKVFKRASWRVARIHKARTDDYFLRPLHKLFKREGYLNAALIDAEPDMPKATAYEWRFRGLTNAYRLVGYDSPYRRLAQDARARASEPDRATMLRMLKALLERAGYLTATLITSEPNMPTARQYQWHFGDLITAYRLIGYQPPPPGRRPRKFIGPDAGPVQRI